MTFLAQHDSLIHAARLGDPRAIDRLMQVCHSDIRRYARRQCLMSDVDDAVQESLLIVAYKMQSLKTVAASQAGCSKSCDANAGAWSGACSGSTRTTKKERKIG